VNWSDFINRIGGVVVCVCGGGGGGETTAESKTAVCVCGVGVSATSNPPHQEEDDTEDRGFHPAPDNLFSSNNMSTNKSS